jgi:hypothetical protein
MEQVIGKFIIQDRNRDRVGGPEGKSPQLSGGESLKASPIFRV